MPPRVSPRKQHPGPIWRPQPPWHCISLPGLRWHPQLHLQRALAGKHVISSVPIHCTVVHAGMIIPGRTATDLEDDVTAESKPSELLPAAVVSCDAPAFDRYPPLSAQSTRRTTCGVLLGVPLGVSHVSASGQRQLTPQVSSFAAHALFVFS